MRLQIACLRPFANDTEAMLARLLAHRRIIWLLGMRLARERYLDTAAGAAWAILNPIAMLAVYWYVFDVGLRFEGAAGQPYVLTLFAGLIPWMFVSESILGATAAVTGRAYLVKKIAFPLEVLPFTHVLSALVTHLLMVAILLGMLAFYGALPGASCLMTLYYLFAACALVSGIGLLLSSLNVFYRDVGQGVGIVTNIFFWATPVVWPADKVSSQLQWLLDFNPVNYIVSGYRDALLHSRFVMPDAGITLYFWLLVAALWLTGTYVFMRLKPTFADFL